MPKVQRYLRSSTHYFSLNDDEKKPDNPNAGAEDPKRQRAIALQYHDPKELPRILATGAGEIAKKIVELAESNGVPIQADDSLTDVLSKLEVGSAISPQSYKLVAEVLAFLYHTDKEWREKHAHLKDVMEPK